MLTPLPFVNPEPQYFNLQPLGPGKVTHTLHQGKMFNLYRALIGAEEVVLKALRPDFADQNVFAKIIESEPEGSESFVRTTRGLERLAKSGSQIINLAARLLAFEAQTIKQANGAEPSGDSSEQLGRFLTLTLTWCEPGEYRS